MRNKNICPVCLGTRIESFLTRRHVPVHQNLLYRTAQSARESNTGELDMNVCTNCGFVFNRKFDLRLLSYGEEYNNSQSYSSVFDEYLDDLVEDLVERQGVKNCTVVEVGCGKGEFLRKLISFPGSNITGFGFDPSYVGPDEELGGRLKFKKSYYDSSCSYINADVVICRHVIEHVPDPIQLLRSVRSALAMSPKAIVFFETPCVDWILENRVIWDFFYEHCSLFSKASISFAFIQSGFVVDEVKHIFGGQYLWAKARVGKHENYQPPRFSTVELARQYRAEIDRLIGMWSDTLKSLSADGKVALWGAGAKGVTFANLMTNSLSCIDCLVDVNPEKQGCYIPKVGYPIVDVVELPKRGIKNVILMNPNYKREVRNTLSIKGIKLNLTSWNHT